nr:MAG TPA: hypothetical protein [Caudoviricetes sp.]
MQYIRSRSVLSHFFREIKVAKFECERKRNETFVIC